MASKKPSKKKSTGKKTAKKRVGRKSVASKETGKKSTKARERAERTVAISTARPLAPITFDGVLAAFEAARGLVGGLGLGALKV